ncbi:MAG: porin, partial [Pseudomonadota bacterium]|nr:porin [Pseudomonadota bacterium]
MKKILLAGTAIFASAAMLASPAAAADGLKLGIGGYFSAYGVYLSQDDSAGEIAADTRNHFMRRESEIHFNGETTLDNGLTVGIDIQLEGETAADQIDESFIYMSGMWGKIIIGSENSAAYLLQVAAPTADGNFDGMDPNYNIVTRATNAAEYRYAQLGTGDMDKITYISPDYNGFKAGISYTPELLEEAAPTLAASLDNIPGDYDTAFDIAARYDGMFEDVKFGIGAGYSLANLEADAG